MNGAFTSGSHSASGAAVILVSSIDTPVTPPSMKLLESRNPFSPIAAQKIPATISIVFSTSRRTAVMHRLSITHQMDVAASRPRGELGPMGSWAWQGRTDGPSLAHEREPSLPLHGPIGPTHPAYCTF